MRSLDKRWCHLSLIVFLSILLAACGSDNSNDAQVGSSTNVRPQAAFSYIASGMVVQFTDESTADDQSISAWSWDFGDGNTSQDQSPSHTFTTPGAYAVTLTVTGANSETNVKRVNILVQPQASFSKPAGLWQFNDASDLTAAEIGSNLVAEGDGFTAATGVDANDGAVKIASGSYYRMAHQLAKSAEAHSKVNEYTLLMDVMYDDDSAGKWMALFQTDASNNNDGEIFIHPDADIGRSSFGYSSNTTQANTWYRIVVSIKNGEARSLYVNGELWRQGSAGSLDDDYGLEDVLLIAADNDGEDTPIFLTNLAIWGQALSAEASAQLSTGGSFIALPTPTVNVAPVIVGAPEYTHQIERDSGAGQFVLNASDANGDDLNWRIVNAAANGSATLVNPGNQKVTVEYRPQANFVGADSFVVEVSDGEFTQKMTVKVTVTQPAPNEAPVITEAPVFSLSINGQSGPRSFVINASDADNDDLNWKITSSPVLGSAAITSSDNSSATLTYTPSQGVYGDDSFTLEVDDGTLSHTVLIKVAVGSTPISYSEPVGFWQFTYGSDLGLATIGNDLVLAGDNFSSSNGVSGDDKAARVALGEHFVMTHGIDAANSPGEKVNAYSLLFDINYEDADKWQALLQTDPSNASDGEIFINPSQKMGGNGAIGGYSSVSVESGKWHRVVITVASNGERKIYLDGTEIYGTAGGSNDDRMSLMERVLIIADESSEDHPLHLSNLALWDNALTPQAAADLGVAGGFIVDAPEPSPNTVPVVAQGNSASLAVGMNQVGTLDISVSDADGDDISWSIQSASLNGVAALSSTSNTQGTLSYTPKNFYVGNDSIVVRVSDGKANVDINVAVTVNPNSAPVISQGDHFALNAAKNSARQDLVLNASDAESDSLTWSIEQAPSNGAATVVNNGSEQATIRYVPANDFVGVDAFDVNVADAVFADSIRVTVTVVDPNADPVITIVAPYGTSTPVAGQHSYAPGSKVTVSVTGEANALVRHQPTGWQTLGGSAESGTGTSVELEVNRPTTLTWAFSTEYYIDTEATSGGSVDVSDGWYNASKPLEITAKPAQGYYFSGWTGDIDGAVMGGKRIVLPLDRTYGKITANFTAEEVFTVVAIPDSQNYASGDISYFESQTQWIVDNKDLENIKFVTHVGDIVNNEDNNAQWLKSNAAMDILNNEVPYGTSPGNHDLHQYYLDYYGGDASRWIDPDTNQVYDWYRGTSPTGWSDYQIVQANGRDWLFLHMDIDARDQDIAWAQAVLDKHPTTLTVLTTHNYLAETGGGGSSGSHTGERGRVPVLWVGGADRNNANQLFEKLIKPNNQIFMVLCGHNFAIYNTEEINDAGNVVHEVLVDYQTLPNGGNGFFRDMEFRWSEGKVAHRTYSESLGRDWDPNINADSRGMSDLHDRENGSHFDIDVDFEGRFDEELTVVSAQGSVYPAVGKHKIGKLEPFVIRAQNIESNGSRERVTGWRLETKDEIKTGSGNLATLTMDGAATLTWQYQSQHLLTTQSVGKGMVSIPTSWQDVGARIAIQAQPDQGARFVRWSGDIDGAQIDGATITLDMDRVRGPVTAEFDTATN